MYGLSVSAADSHPSSKLSYTLELMCFQLLPPLARQPACKLPSQQTQFQSNQEGVDSGPSLHALIGQK